MYNAKGLKKDALFRVRYELKYLFAGFLLTAAVSTFFIYLIIYLIDIEKTNKYNSLVTLVFLGMCTGISVLLIITNSEKIEIKKFKAVLIGIVFWFLGEAAYMFQQSVLNISVPYPSIAELFYFIGYGFLIYHIYKSFAIVNKNKSISRSTIIFVSIVVSLIPTITTIHMVIDGIDISSQYLEIAINLLYYILDTILLVLALLIIYKLPKKDPFIYHWMLFCISMALLTIADFGYTYTSTISDELILITEWLWNLIYAFAYLFLSASLIWYYKLSHLLSKDLDHTFNVDESNRQIISNKGNFKEFTEANKPFIENTEDNDRIYSLLFELIKYSKSEISILLSTPNWLDIPEIKNLLNFVNKRANEGILIRILLHVSIPVDAANLSISNSIFSNPNIRLRYFEKKLTTDAMITLVDLQKAIVLDTKNDSLKDKNKYFATYTNKEEFIFTYLSSFEKIWLLEKVIKCDLE
ncbi:MAG TPA: hypothetical protein VHJ38_18630 [Nitrososphaeraceae archaeon]|nr:hypothetical protein [Nitrososphaeraceae archaeon]